MTEFLKRIYAIPGTTYFLLLLLPLAVLEPVRYITAVLADVVLKGASLLEPVLLQTCTV